MRRLLNFFMNYKLLWLLVILSIMLAIKFWPSNLNLWPSNIILTWTGDPVTTQTVTWQTSKHIETSQIEYFPSGVPFAAAVLPGCVELVNTDFGTVAVHSVKLSNLTPGTTYQYRVGSGLLWSSYRSFTTAPAEPKPFSFLLFGDSQGYSFGTWRDTLQTAYNRNHAAAFIINIGDLVDMGLNYRQWDEWFQAGKGVIDKIPEMAVIGNHETYTAEWEIAQPLLFTAFLQLPANGPPGLKGKVYSFDYGDAHFTFLDTQRQEEAEWIPDLLSLQEEWLTQDLKATTKRWKLVFMHRPIYHNRLIAGDEDLQEVFAPLFERYQVDVVFGGHDHAYARSYPINKGKWSDENGPGPVYITTGRSGDRTFAKTIKEDWDAVYYNPLNQPNYLTVAVNEHNLQVNVYQVNGEIIDSWRKTKD